MKQNFASPRVDKTELAKRVEALRARLKAQNLDGVIVPHDNEFFSEYLPPHDERLAFITGFHGSAGAAVILADRAAVFTDGRYQLQVAQETNRDIYEICHSVQTPPTEWIKKNLGSGKKIGFDSRLHSMSAAEAIKNAARAAGSEAQSFATSSLATSSLATHPLDDIWHDQPAPPAFPVLKHSLTFAGKSAEEKIAALAPRLKGDCILCDPISIAWLLNIRGQDIPHTPIALCYAILFQSGEVALFIDEKRLSVEVREHLKNITLKPPEHFAETLRQLQKVQLDKNKTTYWVYQQVEKAQLHFQPDPCLLPKAAKNKTEVEGMRQAHIRDGAALTEFLFWLSAQNPPPDEISAVKKLEGERARQNNFFDISFDTIAGSGVHGAIIHYRVNEESNRQLQVGELFLVDSGGQYLDGTTDITRTLAIGETAREQKENFTRVLQGHIALASAIFPRGTSGAQLDVLARRPLWQAGLDFDHGTGHGVGAFLSVHEGPQSISPRGSATPLCEGMVLSNEPGYYKPNHYGIRIESLLVVVEKERDMLGFDTISCAPIDRHLVLASMLSADEKNWLNAYHLWVRETLSPRVQPECAAWLRAATEPIT